MKAFIVSYGQDTNGQNARYVDAARRHGRDKRVLKALAIGNSDPAGVVGRFQQAAERYDIGLSIRSAHRSKAYFDFPEDLTWTRGTHREIAKLIHDADVVHLNNSPVAATTFRVRKPMLLHHHGSLFRGDPPALLSRAKSGRMAQAVSTIDLQRPAPDLLHWLPTAYNVDELAEYAKLNRREPDGIIRIVHTPTNRELKHTDLLVKAVRALQGEGLPVELYPQGLYTPGWLPKMTWQESMLAKAQADIVYDQLQWGYGCNSVEAWAMHKPVIGGADPWTMDRMAALWPAIPFEEATEKTLKDVIKRMVESPAMRRDAAARGYAHVRKYHDELPALERLAELYHEAIRLRIKPRIEGKAVTFHSNSRRSMVVDGQVVTFTKGLAVVRDEEVVRKLREFTVERPRYGIAEAEELA